MISTTFSEDQEYTENTMADELERLWEGFTLTEKEKYEVYLSEKATRRSKQRGKRCLIILIFMDKSINKEAFKATITKIWNPEGWIVFNEVGHNRMLTEFQKDVDIDLSTCWQTLVF